LKLAGIAVDKVLAAAERASDRKKQPKS